jgi:A/G-specific adenine glycosylase
VEQGLPYYQKFTEQFPDIHALAQAPEELVLKLWEGLGYYSRARNLHATAKYISGTLGGRFPDTYEGIRALKGVGDYTAAAIASFAFNLPHAVLDGNVYRVLARYFGIETPTDTGAAKKEFAALAARVLDPARPGDFNQAIMDFGATHCTPRQARCGSCPLGPECMALRLGKVDELPVRSKTMVKKDRFFVYFIVRYRDKVFVRQRTDKDIWQNLWEFPLAETEALPQNRHSVESLMRQHLFADDRAGAKAVLQAVSMPWRQVLTHRVVHAVFCEIELPDDTAAEVFEKQAFENCRLVTKEELKKNIAVPRIIARFLQEKVLTLGLI